MTTAVSLDTMKFLAESDKFLRLPDDPGLNPNLRNKVIHAGRAMRLLERAVGLLYERERELLDADNATAASRNRHLSMAERHDHWQKAVQLRALQAPLTRESAQTLFHAVANAVIVN